MIDFLVSVKILVNLLFDGSYRPVDCIDSLIVFRLIFLLDRFHISESVIFQSKPNYFNVTIVQVKVVPQIFRLVRSYRHGILIRAENKVIFLDIFAQITTHFSLRQISASS